MKFKRSEFYVNFCKHCKTRLWARSRWHRLLSHDASKFLYLYDQEQILASFRFILDSDSKYLLLLTCYLTYFLYHILQKLVIPRNICNVTFDGILYSIVKVSLKSIQPLRNLDKQNWRLFRLFYRANRIYILSICIKYTYF